MDHGILVFASRHRELVPDDKFDRHMKRARLQDIDSRKKIFDEQTLKGIVSREERKQLPSSVYWYEQAV